MSHATHTGPGKVSPFGADVTRWIGVLEALDSGVIVLGPDGAVQFANRAAILLTGGPAAFAGSVRAGAAEVEHPGRDGERRLLRVGRSGIDGVPGGQVLMVSDVTERRRHTEALGRVEKLDETLRVLSVISHKINNPLTALLGRAQILKSKIHTDPHVEKAAHVIEESASRIAELARELSRVLKESRQDTVDQLLAAEAAHRD